MQIQRSRSRQQFQPRQQQKGEDGAPGLTGVSPAGVGDSLLSPAAPRQAAPRRWEVREEVLDGVDAAGSGRREEWAD